MERATFEACSFESSCVQGVGESNGALTAGEIQLPDHTADRPVSIKRHDMTPRRMEMFAYYHFLNISE